MGDKVILGEADIIKLVTLAYWRYGRQHIAGAIECNNADVLTISRSLMIAESEIKVSIADMRREVKTKRNKHWRMKDLFDGNERCSRIAGVNYFYFVVPKRIEGNALEVVKELYPYAGLLVCQSNIKNIYGYVGDPSNIYSVKPAKRLQRPKPDIQEVLRIAYAASNTALRYGNKLLGAVDSEL